MSVNIWPLIPWQPVERPRWSAGSYGTDRASVLYRGPSTTIEAFRATLDAMRWTKMQGFRGEGVTAFTGSPTHWAEFGGMSLEDWSDASGTPSFPGIELHYVGFKTGKVPTPHSVDGTSLQSAQGTGTHASRTVSGTIQYRASKTTWTWYETAEPPAVPRYRTVNRAQNPFDSITGYSITDNATGRPVNTIAFADLVTVLNALSASTVVTDYSAEIIVPGKLWACSATAEHILS